jgi:hypothetical protein
MKEKDLKNLFITSIKSGHVDDNRFFPPYTHSDYEFKIKDEGYFRTFDLVIAVMSRSCYNHKNIQMKCIETYDKYMNIVI